MKPGKTSRVLLFALATLGCSVPSVTPGPVVTVVERAPAPALTPIERVLRYFAEVRRMTPDALRQERARQDLAFAEHRSPENRVRLAVLLSLPGAESNRRYALDLLQSYAQAPDPAAADLVDVALFLSTFLQEPPPAPPPVEPLHKPLQTDVHEKDRQLAVQQQRVKKLQEELEAQRATQQALSKQLQEAVHEKERHLSAAQRLNKRLQDERRNVKRLQDKIEKITDIEKSLIERERTDNKGT